MKLNVNAASRSELMALTGISGALADAIIRARPFESADDLIRMSAIGPDTLERLKAQGVTAQAVAPRSQERERQPFQVRIPSPVSRDVGLGDVIKRMTSAVGIRPCGGCGRRAASLNRRFVFSRRGGHR